MHNIQYIQCIGELEFTDFVEKGFSLDQIDNFGWLSDTDLRNNLSMDPLFRDKVRPNLGSMPDYVKDQIEEHSLHILGRSNNPNDWYQTQQNKKFRQEWYGVS